MTEKVKVALIQMSSGADIAENITTAEIMIPVSYTHLRAHETVLDLVCRLLLAKKKIHKKKKREKKYKYNKRTHRHTKARHTEQ